MLPALPHDDDVRAVDHRGTRHRLRTLEDMNAFDAGRLQAFFHRNLAEKAGETLSVVRWLVHRLLLASLDFSSIRLPLTAILG